jgi:hypothetical protein
MSEFLTIRTKAADGEELEEWERETLVPFLGDTIAATVTLLRGYSASCARWRELGTPVAAETADQVAVHLGDAVQALEKAAREAMRWEAA